MYKYTGKESDKESGLMYYGARYYDATVGRFVSVDPLYREISHSEMDPSEVTEQIPHQLNAYAYARNSPISYVDPLGLTDVFVLFAPPSDITLPSYHPVTAEDIMRFDKELQNELKLLKDRGLTYEVLGVPGKGEELTKPKFREVLGGAGSKLIVFVGHGAKRAAAIGEFSGAHRWLSSKEIAPSEVSKSLVRLRFLVCGQGVYGRKQEWQEALGLGNSAFRVAKRRTTTTDEILRYFAPTDKSGTYGTFEQDIEYVLGKLKK